MSDQGNYEPAGRSAERLPRVFVVQQPTRRDGGTGEVVPSMDLSPATAYGELVFVLHEAQHPHRDPEAVLVSINEVMEEESFTENDWLLLVGNPVLIALVAVAATYYAPRLNLLQWDRGSGSYIPVTIDHEAVMDDGDEEVLVRGTPRPVSEFN